MLHLRTLLPAVDYLTQQVIVEKLTQAQEKGINMDIHTHRYAHLHLYLTKDSQTLASRIQLQPTSAPMADILTHDGHRGGARLTGALRRPREPRARALVARRSAAILLAASMHASSVVSMPQFAWMADSLAQVDCSPCARSQPGLHAGLEQIAGICMRCKMS